LAVFVLAVLAAVPPEPSIQGSVVLVSVTRSEMTRSSTILSEVSLSEVTRSLVTRSVVVRVEHSRASIAITSQRKTKNILIIFPFFHDRKIVS
jgi:hypothetical protein